MDARTSRRRFLSLSGIAGLIGVTGGTLFHTYTGPVDLVVQNCTTSTVAAELSIEKGGQEMADLTVELPPRTTDGPGRITKDTIVDNAVRGTDYTLAIRLPNYAVDAVKNDYTVTCTGFSEIGSQRISDRVGVDLVGQTSPERIVVDTSYCGGVF
jgi:hypothetical protein